MLSMYGSDTNSSNNKRMLCRSYSDSELMKDKSMEMATRLTGLYSFSTSNLRSKQIINNTFNPENDKFIRRKKGRKSFSTKMKALKRFIGIVKKKGTK